MSKATALAKDNDFYRLLSAAVEYDALFGDESILQAPLEEGRLYSAGHKNDVNTTDDFTMAIRLLGSSRRNTWLSFFRRKNKNIPHTRRAITPTILSGLCGYLQIYWRQRDTINGQTNLEHNKITLSSSDLVMFCQGRRSQALQQLRGRRKRWRSFFYFVLVMAVCGVAIFLERKLATLFEKLTRVKTTDEWTCGSIPPGHVHHACHFFEATAFLAMYDNNMEGDSSDSAARICQPQESDPTIKICNPSKYSMHLGLLNETLSLEEVKGNRPVSSQSTLSRLQMKTQESVVNQLVRSSIETYSDDRDAHADRFILDLGCGFGGSLYSLLPLTVQQSNPQIARPRRRQAKPHTLHYRGIALGPLEVANARALAELYLHDLIQDEIVNASFGFGNFAADDLPAELKVTNKYSTILAIESLSFAGKNLRTLLKAMFRSLRKGGILIVVDDMIIPKDPDDPANQSNELRIQMFRSTLLRPSILWHGTWQKLFEDVGFTMVEARDLTLEFELLPDKIDDALPRTGQLLVSSFWVYQYQRFMLRLFRLWNYFFNSTGTFQEDMIGQRLLLYGSTSTQGAHSIRKGAYENADLSYNFYVLKR